MLFPSLGKKAPNHDDPAKVEKVELYASEILPEKLKKQLKGNHYTADDKTINMKGIKSFTIKTQSTFFKVVESLVAIMG